MAAVDDIQCVSQMTDMHGNKAIIMGLAIEYHQTPHTDAFDTGYCKSEALENDLRDRTTKQVLPKRMAKTATTLPDSMNAATSLDSFVVSGVLNSAGEDMTGVLAAANAYCSLVVAGPVAVDDHHTAAAAAAAAVAFAAVVSAADVLNKVPELLF